MQVVKVLNTSVVLAVDKQGDEVILMGKGIGFRRVIGDSVPMDESDKVFVLRDRDTARNIIQLAAETNEEFFGVAQEIISYAKDTCGMDLMDHIYLALTDHLSFAVQRVQQGMYFPGFYLLEIRRFNPDAYSVGVYGRKLVEERFHVQLPEAEAGNIAFHFINAQRDQGDNTDNRKMMEIVRDVSEIVKYRFHITYNEDTIAYSRFMTHLQALAQRIICAQQLNGDIQDLLEYSVAERCRAELACAGQINDYIREHYAVPLTKQEELYLAIHIHRVLEENPHLPVAGE